METPFHQEQIEVFVGLGRLRHLPPGAHLLSPALEEGRQLLDELVPLPQTVDPRLWLRQERPDLTAQLAIYASLLELRKWIEVVRHASWYGFVTKPKIPVVIDDERPSDVLLGRISREQLPSRETLAQVLNDLQPLATSDNGERPSPTMTLLAEVLGATREADVNPFDWVRDNQPELAGLIALRHILDESCPRLVSTQIGPTASIDLSAARLQPAPYFSLILAEVIIARDAFVVHATTRIRIDQLPTEVRSGYHVHLSWSGFDQVVDDAGRSYMLKSGGSHSIGDPGQSEQRVSMRYEPTILPEARELRFTSHTGRARISQIRARFPVGEDADLTVKDVPDFPEFSWTYSFPK